MSDQGIRTLARRALELVPTTGRSIIGITGPPGAGKSTLALQLLSQLGDALPGGAADGWVAHVPMDGFHLADTQLERLGLRDRKGAPETFDDGGYAACLRRLIDTDDEAVYVPGFERDLEQPIAAAIAVLPSTRLVITEGNYLLLPTGSWPSARSTMAEVWYCDIDHDIRRERLIARHVEFGKSVADATAWVDRSDEANAVLVESTRDHADLIVATG